MKYKNEEVTEAELYKKLGLLTKNKDEWESSISDVAALLKTIFLTNIDRELFQERNTMNCSQKKMKMMRINSQKKRLMIL